MNGETIDEAVFQVVELVLEHDRCRRLVAVEQNEMTARFACQHGFDDREYRRDPGTGGETDISALSRGLRSEAETARRRHYVDRVAGFELRVGERREESAVEPLNRDAELALVHAGADGIGAPHFRAVELGAQSQILPACEGEVLAHVFRHSEADRDRLRRFAAYVGNREGMKTLRHLAIR